MADSVKVPDTSHLPIVAPPAQRRAGSDPGFAAIQRQLEMNWDEPLAIPSYSPMMAERAAANLLGHGVPQATGGDIATTESTVQRQCEDCAKEEQVEEEQARIQPKLAIGQPGDKYEQEADRVAQQVVSQIHSNEGAGAIAQRQALSGKPASAAVTVMRQGASGAAAASADVEQGIQRSRGQGQPLGDAVRVPMEQAFGTDFSSVRIHTDGESDALNQAVQAKAFTTGQDIYFRSGAYEPGSRGGQELLAHELTHVVQQGGAGHPIQRVCGVDECCPEEVTPGADENTPAGMTSPAAPMSTTVPVSEDSRQSQAAGPQAGLTSADAPMSVPVPVVTSEPEDNEFDTLVQAELEGFLEEFSAIPVTVRWVEQTDTQCVPREEEVAVHPPYFMNVTQGSRPTAAARTVERYDTATGNRGDADRDTRRYLREVRTREDSGGMGMPSALVGKSSPEEIQTILQTAIDRHLIPIPTGQDHLTGADLRNWLVQYGIGVDCSAFVAQALNRVMEQVYGRPLTDEETLNRSGRGTRNARSMTGDARGFSEVEADELRPGDTMGIPGHIRIVTSVRQDDEGNTIFTTAEARAGGQDDVGPDRAEWRYRNGQLQMRRSPEADWSDVDEASTFGRYDRLADAEVAQAEEEAATDASSASSPTTEISIQRQEAGSSGEVSPELEATLQRSRGQGQPLGKAVQAPMEQAFGADFSGVRIHTDEESDALNQAVQAKAFTTGQDIYFRSGEYDPGSRGGQELLAHVLTHAVQQSGQMLQAKTSKVTPTLSELPHPRGDESAPQGLDNPTFLWRLVQTKLALGTSQDDMPNQAPSHHAITDTSVPVSTELVTASALSIAEPLNPPSLQTNYDDCEEETTVQLQPTTTTPTSAEAIQRLSWEDVGNAASGAAGWVGDQASGAAEWVGDRAEDVAELGADAFAAIVERVAPNLAALIRNGPDALLGETLEGGIQSWLQGILGDIDIAAAIAALQASLGNAFATIQGVISGDKASCAAFAQGLDSLRELAQAFMENPAVQAIQEAFATVGNAFQTITDFIVAPVFDTLMEVAGGVFNQVTALASTIWEWGGAVRDYLSDAWDWVLEQLGIGGDGEGGILAWIQEKASAVWDQIKETFAPVIGPLKTVVTIMVALSPAGPIIAAVTYGPQIIEAVQWLWNNKDNPDIVKAAHEEMGNTILPQLLSAAQGFSETLQSTATTLISQVVQMSESVLQLLGAISGVPLLSIAQAMVQTIATGIQEFATWCQESFQGAVDGVQSLFATIQEVVTPYAEVLTSLALALGNPYLIPVMLAGWAWRAIPDCYKPPIIDFLLDAVIGILQALPELPLMGPLWPLLKSGVLGFLEGFKSREDDEKIAITNKLAKIISGASIDFIVGFVKGLLKGIWEGITDPFVLLYSAIQGLGNLIQWLNETANSAFDENSGSGSGSSSAAPAAASSQAAAETEAPAASSEASPASESVASGTIPPGERQAIGTRMRDMGAELQPPAEQVTGGFMPAVQEAFSGGEGITYEQLSQKLGEAWEAVQNAIRGAGQELANKVCEFLLQDSAEGAMGEAVGWLAGTIVFEVILGILTAGSVTAAKGVMKVLKVFAKVLDWTGEVMGVAFKALAKLGSFVIDAVRGLGKLLSNAGGAARAVMDALTEIGEKLMRFADELLGRVGRGAAGEAAETAAERTARETAEAGAERTAREVAEAGSGRAAQEAAEAGAERTARETAEAGGERTGREALEEGGERTTKEGAEETGEEAGERSSREAADETAERAEAEIVARGIVSTNEAIGTPPSLLIKQLTPLTQRYRSVDGFEAIPLSPGSSRIIMRSVLDNNYEYDILPGGYDDIPSVRNGEFAQWFNSLTPEQFDEIWSNPQFRNKIKARLRSPGGMHEWHLVARADTFKHWGVTAEQIEEMRTLTRDVHFINPTGRHGRRGSTTAHNELLDIIDTSLDYDHFRRRLQAWANFRLPGGVDDLPVGLRP